jgi:Flp pilus assembly protein TadG
VRPRRVPLLSSADERGQAALEMLIALPLLLLVLAAVLGFGRVLFVGMAVDQAAFSGGRFAAESLNPQQAAYQAYRAGAWNLTESGLDASQMVWRLSAPTWQRGGTVTNQVAVAVNVADIPLAPLIFGAGRVPVAQAATFRIERWKSRW